MVKTKLKTRIQLAPDTKTYEVWYSKNGKTYHLHKDGFKNQDAALKETIIINGASRLLRDIFKK
jgi:hypothetical protein